MFSEFETIFINFDLMLDDVKDIIWLLNNSSNYLIKEKFLSIYRAFLNIFDTHMYAYTDKFSEIQKLRKGNPFYIWRREFNFHKHADLQIKNQKLLKSPDGGKRFYSSSMFSVYSGKDSDKTDPIEKELIVKFIFTPGLVFSIQDIKYRAYICNCLKKYWEIILKFLSWIQKNKYVFNVQKIDFDTFYKTLNNDETEEITKIFNIFKY